MPPSFALRTRASVSSPVSRPGVVRESWAPKALTRECGEAACGGREPDSSTSTAVLQMIVLSTRVLL